MNDYGTFTVLVRADKDTEAMRAALADPFSLIVSPRGMGGRAGPSTWQRPTVIPRNGTGG